MIDEYGRMTLMDFSQYVCLFYKYIKPNFGRMSRKLRNKDKLNRSSRYRPRSSRRSRFRSRSRSRSIGSKKTREHIYTTKPKMKILVIIVSHEFSLKYKHNIYVLDQFMHQTTNHVDYVGISSLNDFHNYADIISFRYTIVNPKRQFSKICEFITNYKEHLDYDWFIKIRPDTLLIENIPFHQLSKNSINARARTYYGPKRILYGCSIGGANGGHSTLNDCYYDTHEHNIVLDDHIYLFDKYTVQNGAFDLFEENIDIPENEPFHSKTWTNRNIPFHIIGINLVLQKYNAFSGHIPKHLLQTQTQTQKPLTRINYFIFFYYTFLTLAFFLLIYFLYYIITKENLKSYNLFRRFSGRFE